jgi:hypothetical protein
MKISGKATYEDNKIREIPQRPSAPCKNPNKKALCTGHFYIRFSYLDFAGIFTGISA